MALAFAAPQALVFGAYAADPPPALSPRAPPERPPADISWVERPDGLRTADLVVGTGESATKGSRVVVEYTGWVAESNVMFDSSFVRAEPFVFVLGAGQVIRGWDKGVKDMKVGGRRMLYIPAYLAYAGGAQGEIPAHADLIFQVELLDVR